MLTRPEKSLHLLFQVNIMNNLAWKTPTTITCKGFYFSGIFLQDYKRII